jgi:hypothetical protein
MATRTTSLIPHQLLDQIERLRRHTDPWDDILELAGLDIDAVITLVRAGREGVLAALVGLVQHGDADATAVVLVALYPLMASRLRSHPRRRQLLTEDYLGIGYLVLRDIDPAEVPLGHKIVSRTIRRALRPYERAGNDHLSLDAALTSDPGDGAKSRTRLALLRNNPTDEVGDRALSRLSLDDLKVSVRGALDAGTLSARNWELLLDARFGDIDPAALATAYGLTRGGARASIHRTTRRLRTLAA